MWMCPRPWCALVNDATNEDGYCPRCEEREEGPLRQGVFPLPSGDGRPNFREGHAFATCHVGKSTILDPRQAKVFVLDGHAGMPESYDLSIAAVVELSRMSCSWPLRAKVRSVSADHVQLAADEASRGVPTRFVELPLNPTLRGGRLDELFWAAHHSRVPPPVPLVALREDEARSREDHGEVHAAYAGEAGLPPDIVFPRDYFVVYSEAERRRLEAKYRNDCFFHEDLNVDERGVRYLTKEVMVATKRASNARRVRKTVATEGVAPRANTARRSAQQNPSTLVPEEGLLTEELSQDEHAWTGTFPWAQCDDVGRRGKIEVYVGDMCAELRDALAPFMDVLEGEVDEYGNQRYKAVALQSGGGKDRSDFWKSGKFWGYTGQPRVEGKFYRAGLFEEAEMAAIASAAIRVDARLRVGPFAGRRKFIVWLGRGGVETQMSWMKEVGLHDGENVCVLHRPGEDSLPKATVRREGRGEGGITARKRLREAQSEIAASLFSPWENQEAEGDDGLFSDLGWKEDPVWPSHKDAHDRVDESPARGTDDQQELARWPQHEDDIPNFLL